MINEDYAYLRRAMIEYRLMVRENGIYWRIDGETAAGKAQPSW